jgi:hypothetical protein
MVAPNSGLTVPGTGLPTSLIFVVLEDFWEPFSLVLRSLPKCVCTDSVLFCTYASTVFGTVTPVLVTVFFWKGLALTLHSIRPH